MRKTILAVAIMTGLSLNVQASISDSDLADIDSILNETPTAPKAEVKKEDTKKSNNTVTKTEVKTEVKADNAKEVDTKEIAAKESSAVPVEVSQPTLIVPVSGSNFVVSVKRIKNTLMKRTASVDEVNLSLVNPVAEEFEKEPEVVSFVSDVSRNRFVAFNNFEKENDVFTGVNKKVVDGEVTYENIIKDLEYGYQFMINALQYDKVNNRIQLRLDIKEQFISSYNTEEVIDQNGVINQLKVPVLKTTNDTRTFWIKFENGTKIKLITNPEFIVEVTMGHIMPFVKPLVVVDKKKVEELKIEAEKALIEEEKAKEEADIKKEESLFDSLEDALNSPANTLSK